MVPPKEHIWMSHCGTQLLIAEDWGHSTRFIFEDHEPEDFDWLGYRYVVMQTLEKYGYEYLGEL